MAENLLNRNVANAYRGKASGIFDFAWMFDVDEIEILEILAEQKRAIPTFELWLMFAGRRVKRNHLAKGCPHPDKKLKKFEDILITPRGQAQKLVDSHLSGSCRICAIPSYQKFTRIMKLLATSDLVCSVSPPKGAKRIFKYYLNPENIEPLPDGKKK